MATRIQVRRDTSSNWTANNPTLASGEVGYVTDLNKIKVGDGGTSWNSLDYIVSDVSQDGVALGTDTTGDYVASITGSGDGISVSGSGEGASVTISNTGVTSITGTSDEVEVSASSGSITIGLPSDVTIASSLTVGGDFTVNGTTTTINASAVAVEDKNIQLGTTESPTDSTADGGGITLKGSTDKTFNWVDSTDSWTSSEHIDLANGKVIKINGSEVLSSTEFVGNSSTASTLETSRTIELSGDVSGSASFNGGSDITISSALSSTIVGDKLLTGVLTATALSEKLDVVSASSGTATVDFSSSNIYYITTAPSANFTVNLTNMPTTDNRVSTISVFVTQGSTGYIPNVFQIGGVGQTIRWVGGSSPTPTSSAGKIDIFNFTLIRESSSWIVIGNATANI